MKQIIAVTWFAIAIRMVVRTWLRYGFDVVADWVVDSIDWDQW
jgi:hypothetical protein